MDTAIRTKIYYQLTEEAKNIREEVFVKEQGFQEEFDETDQHARHIVAFDGEQAMAVCRLFFQKEEQCYYVGRVAVLKPYRGQGIGELIMAAAEACIRELGGTSAALSGQVRVAAFYERLGYRRQGEEYLDEGCPHVKLVKKL